MLAPAVTTQHMRKRSYSTGGATLACARHGLCLKSPRRAQMYTLLGTVQVVRAHMHGTTDSLRVFSLSMQGKR